MLTCPGSLCKILVSPPLSESLSKMTTLPSFRVPEAFQGRGNCVKGVFCHVLFFFCVCKKWILPPWILCKIFISPLEILLETGTSPAKGPPPLTRNSEQSLTLMSNILGTFAFNNNHNNQHPL